MKKTTFLTKAAALLIVVLFSLTGARAQQTVPYEYGFENRNLSTDGWVLQGSTQTGSAAGNNATGINTGTYAHSGTYGFRFRYNDDEAYLVSPVFTSGWCVDVSFWYKESSTDYGDGKFQVGYTTDESVTDASAFTYGDEVIVSSDQWQQYSQSFPAETKRIAIKHIFNDAHFLCLDDFNFVPLTISGNQEFEESTHVTITCDVEGATILYSTDEGTSWKTYPEGGFDLEETATVTAKATKEGLGDSPEVSKFFVKAGHFTWNLMTNPDDYTITKTADKVQWISEGATMELAKVGNSEDANAYLGGTAAHNHTRMYNGQTLTFAPVEGFKITSIEITTPANGGGWGNRRYYGDELNSRMSSLTNATKTHTTNSTLVTITPTDGSVPVVATFSNEVRVTGVDVTYEALPAPFIAIASVDGKVNESSASVTNKTLKTYYGNIDDNSDAAVVLCDAQGNTASYDWISVALSNDDTKTVTYSLAANTTREARTAYVKVTAGGVSSPVVAIIQAAAIVLADGVGADNTSLIKSHNGEKCSVILDSRTFSPGKWYTLCLPFNVDLNAAGCPLAGADVRKLDEDNTKTRIEGKTLKIEFISVDELKAGTPYIIRWESGTDIVNPVFTDVTISEEREDWQCELGEGMSVWFIGSYAYQKFTEVDQSTLFISSNKFYYVGVNTTIGAQRGYFQLNGFSYDPGSTSTGVKEFGITFDEEDPTGIDNVNVNLNNNGSIYNVAGQRLGKMQKGINIVNGKKIFVK